MGMCVMSHILLSLTLMGCYFMRGDCGLTCLENIMGNLYTGIMTETCRGVACVDWASAPIAYYQDLSIFGPGDVANYCRSPRLPPGFSRTYDAGGPWCFTSTTDATMWGSCCIPNCCCSPPPPSIECEAVHACEDETDTTDITCTADSIQVITANFGRTVLDVVCADEDSGVTSNCRSDQAEFELECNGEITCNLVQTDTYGPDPDPPVPNSPACPDTSKYLEVIYACLAAPLATSGHVYAVACEKVDLDFPGTEILLDCSYGGGNVIKVEWANFGRREGYEVCDPGVYMDGVFPAVPSTNCTNIPDSTATVKLMCDHLEVCAFTPEVSMFAADPCPDQYKYLEVVYRCVPPKWGYHNAPFTLTPDHWSTGWPACLGDPASMQSPINIVTADLVDFGADEPIIFTGWGTTVDVMVENDGHTIIYRPQTGGITISGGHLTGTYELTQFHIHWGSTMDQGSEHTIDGFQYAAEVHFVHVNDADESAVLGLLIQEGVADNLNWQPFFDSLGSIPYPDSPPALISDVLLGTLFTGTDEETFYRYSGSLTTPDCAEAVIWTVFPGPIIWSTNQLNMFRNTLYARPASSAVNWFLTDTYRPVQPPNGRTVQQNPP